MYKRKVQPVSFSLTDPFEKQLYSYALKHGAFSKYIKRLIQGDMERGAATKKAPVVPEFSGNLALVNGRLVSKQ